MQTTVEYKDYKLVRTAVQGLITKDSIIKACAAKRMKPLCDHRNYADGKCHDLKNNWHFSHPSHDRQHGVDVNKVKWAYFYTGPHGHGALLNTENTHRWLHRNVERDGDTFCVLSKSDELARGSARLHWGDTVALWNKKPEKLCAHGHERPVDGQKPATP
jgi:hypothetical protein